MFRRRVLSLIENHKRIIQSSTAHECQGSNFDRSSLDQLVGAIEIHHVVERVIKRAQIRIDFLGEIPRQKTEFLAGFHRWPSQDDANVVVFHQLGYRHGHGEIGFSGSRRADAENDIIAADRIDVSFLRDTLRRDGPLVC